MAQPRRKQRKRRRKHKVWDLLWVARFIAPWEGFRPYIYRDSGGVPTQGFGHTGSGLTSAPWSRAKGLRVLAEDIRYFAKEVDRLVKVPLSIRERIAAISFAFNVGIGGLAESTFLRLLNRGNRKGAANALMMWTKDAAGNRLLGLVRRRRAERWMFLHSRKHQKPERTPKGGRRR
jgi:lysozyme